MKRATTSMVLSLVVLGTAPVGSTAQEPEPVTAGAAAQQHVVREGDTLWDLAARYLGDPSLWPVIQEMNRPHANDPYRLEAGTTLAIPGRDGARAPAPAPAGAAAAPAATVSRPVSASRPAGRTRFFVVESEPRAQTPEAVQLVDIEATRPVVAAGEFYTAAWLAEPATLPVVGELLRVVATDNASEAIEPWLHPFDEVVLSQFPGGRMAPGERLMLVRVGRRVGDWGRVIEPTATVTVEQLSDDLVIARVDAQFLPSEPGNLVLPLAPFTVQEGDRPMPVQDGADGRLIAFSVERALHGPPDLAFVDLGRVHGVRIGDELAAYALVESSRDLAARLPPEEVARLQIVRVEEHSATAKVMALKYASLVAGVPVRVIGRMP